MNFTDGDLCQNYFLLSMSHDAPELYVKIIILDFALEKNPELVHQQTYKIPGFAQWAGAILSLRVAESNFCGPFKLHLPNIHLQCFIVRLYGAFS